MKHPLFLTIFIVASAVLTTHTTEECSIILTSKWCDLDGNCKKAIQFEGKWMLVGSITFKKKAKDPIYIDTISLHWNGEQLDNLIASLYKKNISKDFLPIEDNLICDGIWNKKKQTLILNFDEKETLDPTTIFYLVLTIPETVEQLLKTGSFQIEEESLPQPFKHCAQSEKLSLAINTPPCTPPPTTLIQ
jgi:hypothetical protein